MTVAKPLATMLPIGGGRRGYGRETNMTIALVDVPISELDIYRATLAEPDPKTPQVSTDDLRRILTDGSAIVLDSRKRAEYVAGNSAGPPTVAPARGATPADYAAAVQRLIGGDKSKPLVLYCNGQFCKAGRRLSAQLVEAGFTNVRRYQLGIPVWRALGGPVEIELEGIVRIFGVDRTAVYFDARPAAEFARGTITGAHNVPADALNDDALEKAPLPRSDFNTRLIIFGRDGVQARRLADAIGKTPFQNVSYFPDSFEELVKALPGT
jgi:rhodanese-related sulfurtransferase